MTNGTISPVTYENIGSRTGFQVIPAGFGTVNVYNGDVANVLLISPSSTPGLTNSIPIQPLTNATISGNVAQYAAALTGTIATMTVSAAILTPSPGQIAAQISVLGIPPTDNPQPLNNSPVFNQTIAAGGTFTTPRMTVKQFQSWFGKMFATATASGTGTNPYTMMEMNWSVASDNFDPLRTEDWVIPNTPFNFTYNYINQGQGFVIGDTLTITFTNLDTQPVNITYGLFGSFRTRIRSFWRGAYFSIINPALGLGTDNIVSELSVTVLAGTTSIPQLMNLWEGPVTISSESTPSPVDDVIIQVRPQPSAAFGTFPGYTLPVPADGFLTPTNIILPRRVCTVQVANLSASPVTCVLLVTGEVQPE